MKNTLVSHLKYMDDLKLYAKNREEMRRCIELVETFSRDIQMEFGLDKCAVLHIEDGAPTDAPFISDIPILHPCDSYKYLGVAESSNILHDTMIKKAKSEYIRRVRAIMKAKLTANNTSKALNSFAMPIL